MRKFDTLDCFIDSNNIKILPSDVIQNIRRALLAPISSKPNIQQALQRVNFKFHRACSYKDLIQECNVGEDKTLLMYWGHERSESKATMSVTASSCSSLQIPLSAHNGQRDLRSTAQQTDISCRHPSGVTSPANGNDTEEQRLIRLSLVESLTFSSPVNSALLQPTARSMSILGSVCALLLSKQNSNAVPKQAPSVPGSPCSEHICRICFGGESAERLVRPCSCRGTIAAVHRSCLERWLLQAATSYCELCRHHYVVSRSHKWSWLRSVVEWARSGRGRALAADAWRAAALGAASVLGTARALHATDRVLQAGARRGGAPALAANLFSSLLIGIIGALNGLLTTWMLLKIQEHQMSWQAWRDSTLHVRVALPEDAASARASERTVVAAAAEPDAGVADRGTDPLTTPLPHID